MISVCSYDCVRADTLDTEGETATSTILSVSCAKSSMLEAFDRKAIIEMYYPED